MEQTLSLEANLKQHQQLLINLAMKQAFHVLQLPVLELSEWLKTEIENNPVLEIDLSKESFKERLHAPNRDKEQEDAERRRKDHRESLLTSQISLYEHLLVQAPLFFEDKQDIAIAEQIIGHLNDKGFLDVPLQEILPVIPIETLTRILQTIQTMDPPGVGARNLQESLLLQLRLKTKPIPLRP